MRVLIFSIVIAVAAADFPTSSYSAPPRGGGSFGGFGGSSGGGGRGGGGYGAGGGLGQTTNCMDGEVFHMGRCAKPIINRNVYLYAAPKQPPGPVGPMPDMPQPKVNYNIIFIRTPEAADGVGPIVVPPPLQKTLVYVLSKVAGAEVPQLIEMPGSKDKPEVYYVNYNEGDNPTLPGGIDLKTALNTAMSQQGQTIGGGSTGSTGGGPSSSYGPPAGGGDFTGISSTYGAPRNKRG